MLNNRSIFAVISFTCGIVTLVSIIGIVTIFPYMLFGITFSLPALIFGLIAKNRIKRLGQSGYNLATMGIVIGVVAIVLTATLYYLWASSGLYGI